jgi:hypothetical protein
MLNSQLPAFLSEQLLAETPAEGFDCGDCTACCTVLAVTELNKPMRFACQHQCRDGCRTYLARPSGCRQFNCLWLRGALQQHASASVLISRSLLQDSAHPAEESLRPDHSGVIWDYFIDGKDRLPHLVAFEVWTQAFHHSDNFNFLKRVSDQFTLRLSFRDGQWAEVSNRTELAAVFESRTDQACDD